MNALHTQLIRLFKTCLEFLKIFPSKINIWLINLQQITFGEEEVVYLHQIIEPQPFVIFLSGDSKINSKKGKGK